MKLSVIIVNYNVRFFLEQCLQSVFGAIKNIDAEVFVVDNNSVDLSVSMVKEKYPRVILIENEQNIGFSAANNIAIKKSKGEYILLLNPDTVVEEDTFAKVLDFMAANPNSGAVGVKMIDGKGNFLPESKRGLPTPWVAFYKIFGISKLFPQSKKFGRYHLSYLDPNQTHDVDVLCGAFMMLRKEAITKTGLLDEAFFMYGEDIDLSYRIQKAGYRVVYFPEATIIHYKGESTKKSSLNYVYLFYKAMDIFARKHLTGVSAKQLRVVIQLAIYIRAFLSVVKRIALKILLPLLDAILISSGLVVLAKVWGDFWFGNPDYYSIDFFTRLVPVYLAVWLISLLYSGAYDKPVRLRPVFSGILAGTALILIIYALLPQQYHYSRVIILLGTVLALLSTLLTRLLLSSSGIRQFRLQIKQRKRTLIAGSVQECERVQSILNKLNINSDFLAFVSPDKTDISKFLGSVSQITEIVRVHKITEVIFCSNDIPASRIISSMLSLSNTNCEFKIAPANSDSIIGSNSINTAGDVYVYSLDPVVSAKNLRLKRTFDVAASFLLLLLTPIWIWYKKPGKMLKNIFQVMAGRKTWIGYSGTPQSETQTFIKNSVFTLIDVFPETRNDSELRKKLETNYARNYHIVNDVKLIVKAFRLSD